MPRDLQIRPDLSGRPASVEDKIFEDPTGRRRTFVVALFLTLAVVFAAWLADFGWRVHRLAPASPLPASALIGAESGADGVARAVSLPLAGGCARPARAEATPEVFAYLPAGDVAARAGFRAGCTPIDALLHDALVLQPDGRITARPAGPGAETLADWLGTDDLPPAYPIAAPVLGLGGEALEALLLGEPGAARIAEDLVAAGSTAGAAGVCLSLADHPQVSAGSLRRLMAEWAARAAAAGQETCLVAGPAAGFWREGGVIEALDRAVLLGFEVAGQPYAPASGTFRDRVLAPVAQSLPTGKLVLVPGNFALLWRSGEREPARLSYADSMVWADRYAAAPALSAETGNRRIGFLDGERRRNQIWLLDAEAFGEQMAARPGLKAVALWPLGYEDPAVHDVLAGRAPGPAALDFHLASLGTGPFVTAAEPARPAAAGVVPLPARIERAGAGGLGALAVTFDGLPEPAALPALLASLDGADIRATFFASAAQLLDRAEVAGAVLAAGHGLGTTLLSLDAGWLGADQVRQLGLNRMQLQLADETGRRTVFVRDPSGRLGAPETVDDLAVLRALSAQGYIAVERGFVVPAARDLAPAERLDAVRRGVLDGGTSLLTIDLGAGTAAVLRWLPQLAADLGRDGFAFVGLDDLGQSTASLGALPAAEAPMARDGATFAVLALVTGHIPHLFFGMLALDVSRSLIYLTLALQRRRRVVRDPAFLPGVTVLVPAYNEEAVIDRCLESLARSDYPNMRIIVIDDGSTDRTAEIVRENWLHDRRISLISQPNTGKCHAANHALELVRTPIFVGIDADTIVSPRAISWLVQHFKDPAVGAVAGFVEVGNRSNYLTRAQGLEYLVSQAIGRRAADMLNSILVVPGAIGAWRMAAVEAAGRYSGATITEDADLTVAIHRAGYRVRFEEHARAFTEAPATVGPLVRQRIRWSLGMLQISWKHRGAITEGRPVGFISIIDAVWVSFFNVLLAPLVDLLMIGMAVKAAYMLATAGAEAVNLTALVAVIAYFGLIIVDTALATAAFAIERRPNYRLVALVPLLRFGYRQIVVFAALSALVRAMTGRLYGWNKLSRTGTVMLPAPAPALMPGE